MTTSTPAPVSSTVTSSLPPSPPAPGRPPPPGGGAELGSLRRNAASSYGFRVLRMLSVLVLTPYLFRGLGVAGFGAWSVVFSLAAVFSLVEIGFSTGVTKYVAEFHAAGRRAELADTVGAAVTLMAALAVLALALAGGFALLAPTFAAPADERGFAVGMLVLGAAMLLRFPCAAYGAALQGRQRYDLFNLAEALTVVGFMAGAVAAIELGTGVPGLATAYAGSLVAGGLAFAVLLRRVDPDLGLRPRLADRAARRRVSGFGSLTLLVDSMDFVAQRMDTVVIAAIRGAAAAAPYGAGLRLVSGVQGLVLPAVNLLLPMVSELRARGEDEEVGRRLALATRFALQLTLPLAAGLSLFAGDIARAWLGPETPADTAAIIGVLMAVQVLVLTAVPATKVLLALGRLRAVTVLAVVEGVANLALSIMLISRYGAIGAAVATLVTSGLLVPLRIPLAARAAGLTFGAVLRRAVAPAVTAALAGIAAMSGAWLLMADGPVRAAVGLGAGLALCAAAAVVQLGPGRVAGMVRARRAGGSPG